jgi:hypothetical protein
MYYMNCVDYEIEILTLIGLTGKGVEWRNRDTPVESRFNKGL